MNLLDILFPRRCVGCGRVGKYICGFCTNRIKLREPRCSECEKLSIDGVTHPLCKTKTSLNGLISVFYYQGMIKKAIKLLKYRFVSDTAENLIDLIPFKIMQNLINYLPKSTFIYPIPLHQERYKWRGFNQTEKLAQILSKKIKLPLVENLLVRHAKRIPQADILIKQQRILNAKGIFFLSPNFQASKPQSLLIFDDVWTTGATLKEACKILKKNGIGNVWALTIAR